MKNKIIMDTNVAAKAATRVAECKDEELNVQRKCMKFLKDFVDSPESRLVLDADYEIIREYRNRITMKTDVGKIFWRWFNTYMRRISFEDYLKLDKDTEGNFLMFPSEERTREFDLNDRKFIALSRTHLEHPPIVEATDGKWLGFEDVFEEYGVHIEFLDRDYAKMMYDRKVLNKGK